MATLGTNVQTLADHAKRWEPQQKGKLSTIVEMMSQENELITDMGFMEGNLKSGHRTTLRSGLPQSFWRRLNAGIPSSKSTTVQVDEKCGMLEAYSEVDVALADLGGKPNEYRMSEAQAHIEGMGQNAARTFIYGNSATNPEEVDGLALRYSSPTAGNGRNIVNFGTPGTNTNASIWLVVHNERTFHGIVPEGSKIGLQHEDLGKQLVYPNGGSVGGNKLLMYIDHFKWDVGMVLKDWRYVVRGCNIDTASLNGGSPADLIAGMIKMLHRVQSLSVGKVSFYVNRTVHQYLDIQEHKTVAGAGMRYDEVDGKPVLNFRGIPVKRMDCLLDTEAAVTGF